MPRTVKPSWLREMWCPDCDVLWNDHHSDPQDCWHCGSPGQPDHGQGIRDDDD